MVNVLDGNAPDVYLIPKYLALLKGVFKMINLAKSEQTTLPEQLKSFLDTFIIKHTNIPGELWFDTMISPFNGKSKIRFFDSKVSNKSVGEVIWDRPDKHSDDWKFIIRSEHIENRKYAFYNSDYRTQSTKDLKKALNIAIKNIRAYSWAEIAQSTHQNAMSAHENWIQEAGEAVRKFNIDYKLIYEELKHLIASGVSFKTQAFRSAIENIPMYEEWQERKKNSNPKMMCYFLKDGKYIDHRATVDDIGKPIEELDELVQQRLSMLKLVSNDQLIPTIGFRVDDNTFWVYA